LPLKLPLVYVSSASQPFSEADLAALLKQSRRENDQPGITGMLLSRDRNFIQVLERPEETLLALFAAPSPARGILAQSGRFSGRLRRVIFRIDGWAFRS
jgi:hypothetical protein